MPVTVVAFTQPRCTVLDQCDFNAMVLEDTQLFVRGSPQAQLVFQYVVQMDLPLYMMCLEELSRQSYSSGTRTPIERTKLGVLKKLTNHHCQERARTMQVEGAAEAISQPVFSPTTGFFLLAGRWCCWFIF